MQHEVDFLVIGSGVAGLLFARHAARHGTVLLVTKDELEESNTRYAQGGVAVVWDREDTAAEHVRDTLVAGAGLCRREVVDTVVNEGPGRIRELIELGVEFSRDRADPNEYELGREGGHGKRRILHAKDATGAEIIRALVADIRSNPNVRIQPWTVAVDLITTSWLSRRTGEAEAGPERVVGAYLLDVQRGEVDTCSAGVTALCTGGAGRVYLYTSNPEVATGDGLAMAWRAGADMHNMEFVQFHPTSLFHPSGNNFLISEALRGEGGKLRLASGERFMDAYDERGELAPRDIVARAIDSELKHRGVDCVYLDMTHHPRSYLEERFPSIFTRLKEHGVDLSTDPIPVVPACHYFCGGVGVDLHGESSVHNLFVVGETACTGLHGANRLASNSLLEAVVFAHRAAERAAERLAAPRVTSLPQWDPGRATDSDELVVVKHTWDEIRRFMWSYVGIVRTTRRLKRARHRVELIQDEVRHYYWDFKLTSDLVQLRNLATVAGLVVQCALLRNESRGLHYTEDHPDQDARFLEDTVVRRRRP